MSAGLAAQPDHSAVSLTALPIGNEVWLHLPGEIVTPLGDRILAHSPSGHPVIAMLAEHCSGYLAGKDDVAPGDVSTLLPRMSRVLPYQPDAGDALADGAVQLLHSLGGLT